MRRLRSLLAVTGAVLMTLTAVAPEAVAARRDAAPAVEINSQNPVTAAPPVSRPHTRACTETLADHFPSNTATGAPQQFSGTVSPPAGCRGPWAKVVLDWTTSVRGRQYDRSGGLVIGGTQVYFGTTYEPDPAGITYHFAKDLTEYGSLLRTAQSYSGGIGNYVNSVDTGVYEQTVTLTFYQATRSVPAPVEPDAVVGLGEKDASVGTPVVHLAATGLPRNITRAYLEVYIKGNGCDEQWFTDVPDDLAAKDTAAALCGHGAYREVDAAVDGRAAGVTQYFPYIYTGGIVPTLWRPIPAVGTFDMSPELMDVTPFAGQLVDGGSHDIALSVANIGDTWNLSANLVLYTDHHAAQTSGAVTADTIAQSAVTHTTEQSGSAGAVTATVTAARNWTLAGYVAGSAGRVTTSVTQHAAFRNVDTVTNNGFAQQVRETDAGWNSSRVSRPHSAEQTTVHGWSYPVAVTENAQVTDDNNFNLSGAVELTRILADWRSDGGGWTTLDRSSDEIRSKAIDQRANGITVQADGTESEHYVGTDDTGGWYDHYLAAAHGYVTVDRLRRHRR